MATASVLCKVGDFKPKGVKSKVKDGTIVQIIQKVNGVNTTIGTAPVTIGQTDVNKPPVVSAGEDQNVKGGVKVILDGSAHDEGRIVRAEWKQTQGMIVDLIPDPNDITNVSFIAPELQEGGAKTLMMLFEFEAEDDKAEITKDACIITVGEKIKPPDPPVGGIFPVSDIQWLYSSDEVLSHNGTFPTKKRSPFDPVLLFSNASGVDSHKVNNKWLTINTGQQFGRCYWELYELPQFASSKLGKEATMCAGVFKMAGLGDSDYSTKLGDHGTTGYDFDGKKFFGGFGQSFHPDQWESKCEWKHGTPEGKEVQTKYPGGKKLEAGQAYPYFSAYIGDEAENTMTLNTWMKFPGSDEWVHVGEHIWKKDSEWENNAKSIPKDAEDFEAVQKGPGFIKCDHNWTRANQGNVDVQKIMYGTLA